MLKKVETEEAEPELVQTAAKPRGRLFDSEFWYFIRPILQFALMFLIIFAAYQGAKRMIASKPPTQQRPAFKTVYTIETVRAEKADNQPKIISYGQTVAARNVDLRSLVSGEIIAVSPNLKAGANVDVGEVLVSIDKFNYEGALQEAKANLAEAEARMEENRARISLEQSKFQSAKEQLAFAQADLDRASKLRKRGTSTQQQLEARELVVNQRTQSMSLSRDTIKVEEARLAQMRATIERLDWKVTQAQRNLDSTKLIAPFSGVIRSSAAEKGRLVSANDVVVSMYEKGLLEVRFTLSDAQYGRLQADNIGLIDRSVQVSWTIGGKTSLWSGKVDRLGAEITSSRGGVEVFATLDANNNKVAIRPGAFVEVIVPDTTFSQTISVPDTAIYGQDKVYVAVDGKLVEKSVTIAAFDGENALIQSGLDEGDEVLITRITEVSEGLSVRTQGEASANGAATGDAGQQGRPDRAEMAKILQANDLTFPQFRALSREQKAELIAKWRASQPAAGK